MAEDFQFCSCFISHFTQDEEFADQLYADLKQNGVGCWFAPHDIQGGKRIHEQIEDAIRDFDRFLLILSDASMCSPWVTTEIANALDKERQAQGRVLFPIRLISFERIQEWTQFYADIGEDSARTIREYFIPDFSEWKDQDKYQHELKRLLRDLRIEDEAQTHLEPIDKLASGWNPGAAAIAAGYCFQDGVNYLRARRNAAYVAACRREARDPGNPGAAAEIGKSNGEIVVTFRKEAHRPVGMPWLMAQNKNHST